MGVIDARRTLDLEDSLTFEVSYHDAAGAIGWIEVHFREVDGNWVPSPPFSKDDCP